MVIPSHAKKVFSGINIDVFHWEQEEFDGSSKTYESALRSPGVQVIGTRNGKILISHERQPHRGWFLTPFGGIVERGEDFLLAGKRELLEEVGMESDDWEELIDHPQIGRFQLHEKFFVARNCRKVAEPTLEAGEDIHILELSWDEFLERIADHKFRNQFFAWYVMRLQLTDPEGLGALKQKILG